MKKRQAKAGSVVLGMGIVLVGVLAGFIFGRIDTMAGLVFLAAIVIWQSRS